MRAVLSAAIAELGGRVADESLCVLSAPCRRLPPRRLLDLSSDALSADVSPAASFAWDARDLGDPQDAELRVARGEVVRLVSAGRERLRAIRARAESIHARVIRFGDEPGRLRWFGGASFAPGADLGPFGPFGEASFSLPRIELSHGKGGARLQLIVRGAELRDGARVTAEVDRILSQLDHPASPPASPVEGSSGDGAPATRIASYEALVERALSEIARRRFDKVVVARSRDVALEPTPTLGGVLDELRRHQPGSIRFAFGRGGLAFVGASPERLVARSADRARADALAGSAPIGPDVVAKLLGSDKDRREHEVVARAIRDVLARWAARLDGPTTPGVRRLRDVAHLFTPVVAVGVGAHVLDLADALHPTPALCGWPSRAAEAWIVANEETPRGWYGGPVGWFDDRGDGVFAVAIRSALLSPGRARLFAGAGIVAGSDPARELGETEIKLGAMRRALGLEAPGPLWRTA